MLLASLAVTAIAGVLFALAPAIQSATTDIAPALKAPIPPFRRAGTGFVAPISEW